MFEQGRARVLLAVIGVLAGLVPAERAMATQSCPGSYATAVMQALPAKVVANLDIHDRSARNLELSERFLAGLRDAGVQVGAQPNVLLHVDVSQIGKEAADPQWHGAVSSYSGLAGLQGGPQVNLPALPSAKFASPRSQGTPPLLFIRIDATVGDATRISWVATIQCQMLDENEKHLAEDLGRVVGGALGKRIERRAF